jgi:hypothetical protein
MWKVSISVLLVLTLVLVGVHFRGTSGKEEVVDFRPVYLSNVSLGVRFSNEGLDLLVVNFSALEKLRLEENKPVLIAGSINVTRLIEVINVTTSLFPVNASPKAVILYNGRLILLESGNVGEFLNWARWVIAHESHWRLGIYSGNSGVLLNSREVVGGEIPKRRVAIDIIVPERWGAEFSLTPVNGELFDYSPTTSKLQRVLIHDRSDFSENLAGWIVEKKAIGDVNLEDGT